MLWNTKINVVSMIAETIKTIAKNMEKKLEEYWNHPDSTTVEIC